MLISKIELELEMLERHLLILKYVIKEEPIGIMKLAEITKLPKHKVRYSLRVLEHEGLIGPSMHGAVTTDKTRPFVSMTVILHPPEPISIPISILFMRPLLSSYSGYSYQIECTSISRHFLTSQK